MSRKDYRNELDQHRQSLSTDELEPRPTRSQRNKGKNKKNRLIQNLLIIFILIPLCVLVYVWKFYEPEDKPVKVDNDVHTVTFEENKNSDSKDDKKDVDENKDEDEEKEVKTDDSSSVSSTKDDSAISGSTATKSDSSTSSNSSTKNSSNSSSTKNNSSTNSTTTSKNNTSTSSQSTTANKQKESTTTSSQSKNDSTKKSESSSQRIHVVKANENLFKIAKQYYSNPGNGVELIKRANGLKSDVIYENQRLIIP